MRQDSKMYSSDVSKGAAACVLLLGMALCGPLGAQAQFTEVLLNEWTAERGSWTVATDKKSVKQTVNGPPVFFYSPFEVIGSTMQGKISVETTGDDDFVGFALGFNPGDSWNENADYLLVDWKQLDQTHDFTPSPGFEGAGCTPGTAAKKGLAVSRVFGTATVDELWGHRNLVGSCADLDSGVEELQRGATLHSTGWKDWVYPRYVTYTFRFEMTSTSLKVYVAEEDKPETKEIDITGTFSNGRLAFYNFSQAGVKYSGYEAVINNAPVAVDDEFDVNEDTILRFTLADLLANDTDLDPGDVLTAAITGPPAHGGYSVVGGNVTYTPYPDFFGTDTMTYTVSDQDGASDTGTITITVTGTPDPPVALSKPATIYLGADGFAHLDPSDIDNDSYDPDDPDNPNAITLSCREVIFTGEDLGEQHVTLTVTDQDDDVGRIPALVTVEDKIPPTITAPDDMTVEGTSPVGVPSAEVSLGEAVASDNDSFHAVIVTNDAPALFEFGPPIVVTWTATDGSGITATDTQIVTVVDTTAPIITLTGDAEMTLELGGDPYAEQGATAKDVCDPEVTVNVGGDTVDINTTGTYVLTYNATDKFGNDALQVTRTVHVLDSKPPDIESVAVNSDTLWPPNHKMVPITVTVVAADNVDGTNITTEILSVVSSEPDDGRGDGKTGPDIELIDGTMTVNLRAERSGNNVGRVYTITVQCTDLAGNSSTADVLVTVPHDQGNGQQGEAEPAEESNGGGKGKGKKK